MRRQTCSSHPRHPTRFVAFLTLGILVVAVAAGTVMHFAAPRATPFQVGLAVDSCLGIFALLVVARLRWFQAVGLGRVESWQQLRPYWPLLLVVAGSAAYQHSFRLSGTAVLVVLLLALVVGFAEEVLFRGIILRALASKGTVAAVVASSLLFAALHLLNGAGGADVAYVVLQVATAFAIGVAFAALRIRAGTLWPLIGVHAALDYVSYAASAGHAGTVAMSLNDALFQSTIIVVLLAYGAWELFGGSSVQGSEGRFVSGKAQKAGGRA